jgi:hypothetical protein
VCAQADALEIIAAAKRRSPSIRVGAVRSLAGDDEGVRRGCGAPAQRGEHMGPE